MKGETRTGYKTHMDIVRTKASRSENDLVVQGKERVMNMEIRRSRNKGEVAMYDDRKRERTKFGIEKDRQGKK